MDGCTEYGKIPDNTSRQLSQARLEKVLRKYTSITVPPFCCARKALSMNFHTMEIQLTAQPLEVERRVTCVVVLCLLLEGSLFKWVVEVVILDYIPHLNSGYPLLPLPHCSFTRLLSLSLSEHESTVLHTNGRAMATPYTHTLSSLLHVPWPLIIGPSP